MRPECLESFWAKPGLAAYEDLQLLVFEEKLKGKG